MPVRGWTIALSVCMLTSSGRGAMAQRGKATSPAQPRTTVPAARTTLAPAGTYTAEQASRGRYVYAGTCRTCHTAESHTGAVFAKWWRGKQLSELYAYVSQNMPKNDPGTLSPEDAADVVAYLLKMNTMPAGKTELPPDLDELKKIRIETKRTTR